MIPNAKVIASQDEGLPVYARAVNPQLTERPSDDPTPQETAYRVWYSYDALPFGLDEFKFVAESVVPGLVKGSVNRIYEGGNNATNVSDSMNVYDSIGGDRGVQDVEIVIPSDKNPDKPPVTLMHSAYLNPVAKAYGDVHTVLAVGVKALGGFGAVEKKGTELYPFVQVLTVSEEGILTPRGYWQIQKNEEAVYPHVASTSVRGVYRPRTVDGLVPCLELSEDLSKIANMKNPEGHKITCRLAIKEMRTSKTDSAGVSLSMELNHDGPYQEDIPLRRDYNPTHVVLVSDNSRLVE